MKLYKSNCGECLAWQNMEDLFGEGAGFCRRHAPQVSLDPGTFRDLKENDVNSCVPAWWPITDREDWCCDSPGKCGWKQS